MNVHLGCTHFIDELMIFSSIFSIYSSISMDEDSFIPPINITLYTTQTKGLKKKSLGPSIEPGQIKGFHNI